MKIVEILSNIGLHLLLIGQLFSILSVIELRYISRSIWILFIAYIMIIAAIICVIYETSFFGF